MLLADEMDAAWEQVTLEQSTLDGIYNNQAAIVDSLPFQPDDDGFMARSVKWLAAKIMRELPGVLITGGSSSMKDQWLPMRQAGASRSRRLDFPPQPISGSYRSKNSELNLAASCILRAGARRLANLPRAQRNCLCRRTCRSRILRSSS